MRRHHLALATFLLFLPLYSAETLKFGGYTWSVPFAADWKIEDGLLNLIVERPQREPRRPIQFALADTPEFSKVTIECEAKRVGGSLIVVFAYKDPTHFNYAHFSVDSPSKQPVHNGIFHVYGGERVRISNTEGPGSLPSESDWYKLRVDWDGATGLATATVNGQTFPSLRAVDVSLTQGRVGIGSFFEKGVFRNVKITGTPAK